MFFEVEIEFSLCHKRTFVFIWCWCKKKQTVEVVCFAGFLPLALVEIHLNVGIFSLCLFLHYLSHILGKYTFPDSQLPLEVCLHVWQVLSLCMSSLKHWGKKKKRAWPADHRSSWKSSRYSHQSNEHCLSTLEKAPLISMDRRR